MHLLLALVGFLVYAILKSADDFTQYRKGENIKKRLAPNGYEMEYLLTIKYYNEVRDIWDQRRKQIGDEPAFDETDRLCIQKLSRWPVVQREFDKSAQHGTAMMRVYAITRARLEVAEAGRIPKSIGKTDPQPLPIGTEWALNYGDSTVPMLIPKEPNEYMLAQYRREDAASERELARIRPGK